MRDFTVQLRRPPRRSKGLSLALLGLTAALGLLAGGAPLDARAQSATARVAPTLADGSLDRDWELDGTGAWALRDGVLSLVTAGKPGGAIRRPAALAVVRGPDLTETTLEVELRSTAALPPQTPRRDVLLVVGYQSPTRFYYVHISAVRDDVHNGIFVVNDADRRRIDTESAIAPLVDQAWHRARLVRTPATGRIEVYVDARATPIMVATDTTLTYGRAGVGSFDDTAEFRTVVVSGARK
jgi:hypothetical protein